MVLDKHYATHGHALLNRQLHYYYYYYYYRRALLKFCKFFVSS